MAVEKLEGSKVKITFDVTKEMFKDALDKAFIVEKDKVSIKGFRKGQITRAMYEKKFGVESLYNEALMTLADELYPKAVSENNLMVVGQPELDIDFANVNFEEEFQFAIIVPVYPEVKLGKYKGVSAKAKDVAVTDEEVNKAIDDMRKKNSVIVPKETGKLEKGDIAVFDFAGYKDGVAFPGGTAENYELEIGSGQFIPGFEDQMVGMEVNEEKTINVTFPAEYHEASLAGAPVEFKIKLHEMKIKELPEVNEEFVKELNIEGVNNKDELTSYVLNDIKAKKEENEQNRLVDELITKICTETAVEIPEAMINNAVNDEINEFSRNIQAQYNLKLEDFMKITNTNEEDFKKNMSARAIKRLTETIVLEAIIKEEKIQATEEDFEEMYQEIATANNVTIEVAKEKVNKLDVAFHLNIKKAIDLIVDSAELV